MLNFELICGIENFESFRLIYNTPYFALTYPHTPSGQKSNHPSSTATRILGSGTLCFALLPIVLVDPAQVPDLTGDLSGVRHMRRVDLEGADNPR